MLEIGCGNGADRAMFAMHGAHYTGVDLTAEAVHRVLKPGGVAKVMLYHRHSFNYYVRILGYMRARLLCEILRRAGRWASDRRRLRTGGLSGVRGNASAQVWQLHYENFLRQGWRYLATENFAHHCADGPECPYAFAYTRSSAAALFAQFSSVQMRIVHSRWAGTC